MNQLAYVGGSPFQATDPNGLEYRCISGFFVNITRDKKGKIIKMNNEGRCNGNGTVTGNGNGAIGKDTITSGGMFGKSAVWYVANGTNAVSFYLYGPDGKITKGDGGWVLNWTSDWAQTNQDSGWRLPDVFSVNFGIVAGAGGGVNISWDWRHNRGYLGLSGAAGVGGKYSLGLTGSWVLGSNGSASAEAINGIYTGFSTSESGGFIYRRKTPGFAGVAVEV